MAIRFSRRTGSAPDPATTPGARFRGGRPGDSPRSAVDFGPMRSILFVAAPLLVLSASCGDDAATDGEGGSAASGGSGGSASETQLPCDLAELFATRCQECHSDPPKFGAAMPLVSRDDLLATALDGESRVVDAVLARLQASDNRMPPPPKPEATAEEIALIQAWVDAGTPERPAGDTCGGTGGAGGSPPVLDCEPDITLTAEAPFEMPQTSTDEQVCFGIDLDPLTAKRHITAIAPRIDNDKIIHHILFMQAPSSIGPGPTSCNFTSVDWKLLYAWGPGTPPHVLPSEAGFPIEEGEPTHFVIQVHYNNLQGLEGEVDQSGIDLCTTEDLRPNDADIMAFGSLSFPTITPNATSRLDCDLEVPAAVGSFFPITIFQSWPHMHQLGAALSGEIEHAAGGTSTLVDVPDYDFDYQLTYPNDVQLNAGDTVRTSCTWENTTSQGVGFGEDTGNEMCFNFVSYYPRIELAQWHWLLPSYSSTCTMTTL